MDFPSIFSLAGKKALVAGASRGIGLAIAKGIAAAGAETILAARSLQDLEREAAALRDHGYRATALHLDFTDVKLIDSTAQTIKNVDILINVAGTNIRKLFEQYSEAEYKTILDTNLNGIVRLTQQVGKEMITRGGGSIIMIGSLTSLLGLPYITIYGLTKSAIAGLTRCLAAEWGRHNIRVNCIAPGFILTDLNRSMWEGQPAMRNWLAASQADPRMGSPEDIVPLAVFLSGSGADYITGQVIPVDGGFSTTSNWPFDPGARS
jgi:NAD(P)-dependent dehydrogenase (short-subunit alcohol dehydrogenase family)